MRKKYLGIMMVISASLCLMTGCKSNEPAVETTEAAVAATESVSLHEPVTDETWEWLLQTYQLLEANYPTGKQLVDSGMASATEAPEEITAEAQRLLSYGEQCGHEDLTEEDGQELLYEMVEASNNLMDMIEANGGTVTSLDDLKAQETAENAEGETEEIQESVESTETIETGENTESGN